MTDNDATVPAPEAVSGDLVEKRNKNLRSWRRRCLTTAIGSPLLLVFLISCSSYLSRLFLPLFILAMLPMGPPLALTVILTKKQEFVWAGIPIVLFIAFYAYWWFLVYRIGRNLYRNDDERASTILYLALPIINCLSFGFILPALSR